MGLARVNTDTALQALAWLQPVMVQAVAGSCAVSEQQQEQQELLQRCLDSTSQQLVPLLASGSSSSGGDAAGAAVSDLLAALVAAVEAAPGGAVLPEALLTSFSACAACLAAACNTQQQQQQHLITACEWATAYAQQQARAAAPAAASTCSTAELKCCVASAVLAALRPDALQGPSTQQLLESLLGTATSVAAPTAAAGAAGIALGAVLNKWGDAAALEQPLQAVLQALMQQQGAGAGAQQEQQQVCRLTALSWVGRGLAMRSHPAASSIIQHAVQLLAAGPGSDGSSSAVLTAAAQLYGTLVSDTAQQAGLQLSRALHCRCKVLWQQRTYTMALHAISDKLQQQGQQAVHLLLAFLFLVQGTPGALHRQELVAGLLVRALDQVQQADVTQVGWWWCMVSPDCMHCVAGLRSCCRESPSLGMCICASVHLMCRW